MLIRRSPEFTYADVTPKSVYLNRRKFLRGLGVAGIGAFTARRLFDLASPALNVHAATKLSTVKSPFSTDEKINSYNDVTHYNNFYEFGVDKDQPAKNATHFATSPWSVSVGGEVKQSRKFTMDEILKLAPLEERIYRHRCVEGWSIVVPWIGFSFSVLANLVEPTPKSRFVAFESYYVSRKMPLARYANLDFPYVEGLRLDGAMHPLTLRCVGLYGEQCEWKYGFKSI